MASRSKQDSTVLQSWQELNRSLEANKPQLLANLEQAQRDLDAAHKAREEWVPKLEEKVAALMLKLDTGVAAAAAGEGGKPAREGPAAVGSAASMSGNGGGDCGSGCGGGSGNDRSSGQQSSGGVTSGSGASSACSVAGDSEVAMKTPSVTGREAGAGAGAVGAQGGESGGGGGAEETKGAGGSLDDDRGGDRRRGSSQLSGPAGGGSNSGSGKKKGRRRKSK